MFSPEIEDSGIGVEEGDNSTSEEGSGVFDAADDESEDSSVEGRTGSSSAGSTTAAGEASAIAG